MKNEIKIVCVFPRQIKFKKVILLTKKTNKQKNILNASKVLKKNFCKNKMTKYELKNAPKCKIVIQCNGPDFDFTIIFSNKCIK